MPPALWVQRSEQPKLLPADMEVADARRVVLCGIAAARAPKGTGAQGLPVRTDRQQAVQNEYALGRQPYKCTSAQIYTL